MTNPCSLALLEMALAESISAEQEETLHRHLEECEACAATLDQMAGGDAWRQEAAALLSADELDEEKGDSPHLCEAPSGPFRQMGTVPFFPGDEWSNVDFSVEHLEPSDQPNVLGRLGGYDVLEIIGRGGMGIVLKGFDRELKRCVAIKVLAPHLAQSSLAKKRFAREAQAAAAVVHPNVLAIHQVQPNGRLPFLVMPLVAGESLAQRLTVQGRLELKETLRIGMQAAAGLAAAHEQGLVHRDVKPANILLEKGVERAVLTDFGLARAADDVSMTRWGIIAGTPQYMSPEQARGEPLDGRSDLFSLGCVLYEMATGVSPFRADSTMATLRRLIDDPPRAIASLNPELPPWFVGIVERLLEKDPSRRFGSAKEVSELLEGCLAHVQQPASVPLPAGLRTGARNVLITLRVMEPVPGRMIGFLDRAAKSITRSVMSTRSVMRSVMSTSNGRRVLTKGAIAMLSTLGVVLLGALLMQATEPPDIAGNWSGEGWGQVVLTQSAPGEYAGTYSDTVGKEPGKIQLKWSRIERRFNGTWSEGEVRFGELSIRPADREIRGALTTDPKSKINPATPRLADLTWIRPGSSSGADLTKSSRTWDLERQFSAKTNPAGAWSYGYTPDLDSGYKLTLYDRREPTPDMPLLDRWGFEGGPVVSHNPTDMTLVSTADTASTCQPHTVYFHPGVSDFCVVRWTAPQAGSYTLRTTMANTLPGSDGVDIRVIKNTAETLFQHYIYRKSQDFSKADVTLAPGDTIDFVVGRHGDTAYDTTSISAQIEAVPSSSRSEAHKEATKAPGTADFDLSETKAGDGRATSSVGKISAISPAAEKHPEPPPQFGPVVERTLNALGEGQGGEGLDLASSRLLNVPKDFFTWPREQQEKWGKENNVDLVVDPGPDKDKVYVHCVGLTTATLGDNRWDNTTSRELQSAVARPSPDAVYAATKEARDSQGRQEAMRGHYAYYLNNLAPVTFDRAGTFAFQTRKGDLGILQVIRSTEEPRGVRIRYKLLQPSKQAPQKTPPTLASLDGSEPHATSPAAEPKALQGVGTTSKAPAEDAPVAQTEPSEKATIAFAGICHDDRGRPIARADVFLYRADIFVSRTQERLQSVKTGEDGKFRFMPVANLGTEDPRTRFLPQYAPYRIIAKAKGKATEAKFVPHASDDPEHIDVSMAEGAVLYGAVNAGGRPVKGACVWSIAVPLPQPVPGIACAITDNAGVFQIRDLRKLDPPDGPITDGGVMTYEAGMPLHVRASGFADKTVKCSKVPGTVAIELEPAAVVEGRVVDAENEKPAAGVFVQYTGINSRSFGAVLTDADGRYRLDALGYGNYNIWAVKDGYTMRAIDSLEAIPGTTKTAADLRLVRGGFIVGHVRDAETGRPVYPSDAEAPPWHVPDVAMYGPARPQSGGACESAPIQKDGSFRLRAAPGSNHVYLRIFGRLLKAVPPAAMDVDVADGQTVTIDFKVRKKTEADEPQKPLPAPKPVETPASARQTAQDMQSGNNLGQLALLRLGLAMHNYHDSKGHLPPAVLYGPDGKTPHSWRVAMLPYLDDGEEDVYDDIYKKYRFDEPWDGPNNRKLLEKVPRCYRGPTDRADSPNACYFALVGPGAIFDGEKGTSFNEIKDGMSTTIMLVEAKRDIPWTKPEDIPCDPEKPLPRLGGYFEGGFHVATAAGRVHFLPSTVSDKVLRALITKAGGEPVTVEDAMSPTAIAPPEFGASPPLRSQPMVFPSVDTVLPPLPLGLYGFCPVSLSEKQQWVPGDHRFAAMHRGRTYLFAGPEQRRRFLADPDRYTSAVSDIAPGGLSHRVAFDVGETYLRDGDRITIDEIHGTADTIKAGNVYEIKGTYRLASHDKAMLAAYTTVDSRDPANEQFRNVPSQNTQSMNVDRGEGPFTLVFYMWQKGKPHVSFYADGGSFASVYFGTGDSAPKKGSPNVPQSGETEPQPKTTKAGESPPPPSAAGSPAATKSMPEKQPVLSSLREKTARQTEATRSGQATFQSTDKVWRSGMGEKFRTEPSTTDTQGRVCFDGDNICIEVEGRREPSTAVVVDAEGRRQPSTAGHDDVKRHTIVTKKWTADWDGRSDVIHLWDPPGGFRADRSDPRVIAKAVVLDPERLSVTQVTHEGRECYRLEEVVPGAGVRAVQILDPERDLVLVRREIYYDNASRAARQKLRDDYPFQIQAFDHRKDAGSGVWVPIKYVEQAFETMPQTENRKPALDREVTTEFADYSFAKPPAKFFTLYHLRLAGAHRLRDNRKGHAQDNWHNLPSPGNWADPTFVPDVKGLPPDLAEQWLKDAAWAQ